MYSTPKVFYSLLHITSLFTPMSLSSYAIATSEGSISMRQGEEFSVLEKDSGDGWTRVQRLASGGEQGFVPTSYVQCRVQTSV